MKNKGTGWWIVVAMLAALALFGLPGASADEVRPPRRHVPQQPAACPPGHWCSQEPPAGPAFTTDGDAESQATLAEIREVLMRRGCQIAVVERINEDGTRTPALQVERVWYFIAMP